jgi:hypothetical protein
MMLTDAYNLLVKYHKDENVDKRSRLHVGFDQVAFVTDGNGKRVKLDRNFLSFLI